jgi:dienelactone hydrolase
MADRLMDGAHRFVERKIATAITRRDRHWNRDSSNGPAAYEASIDPNRQVFRRLIGVVDDRVEPLMQRFGDDLNPAMVAETSAYRVHQVRWKVLRTPGTGGGVWGEGLLVEPPGDATGYAVVVPDADQTPEQVMGLAEGIEPESRTARRLAEAGFTVVIPTVVNRQRLDASRMQLGPEATLRLGRQDQTHREWLYRQAYHMGRHVIGYEVQKVLAAVEWLKRRAGPQASVGVTGYGEGGLIAFYAAAADPAIDAVLVSGYFDSREDTWTEPVYRNVWALLDQFGDAEIATLIAPRGLVVEHSPVTEITDHKGQIRTSEFASVRDEFERIESLVPVDFHPRTLVYGENGEPVGPGSVEALRAFATKLAVGADRLDLDRRMSDDLLDDRRVAFEPDARHLRQVQQIQGHVQMLVRNSVHVRNDFYSHALLPELADLTWSTEPVHETLDPGPFIDASRRYRDDFDQQIQGRFDEQLLPPNPRTRLTYEEEKWVGYDVVLDVFEELVAWGVLMLPRDLEPGERRPVVVVQHGRNGLPEHLIAEDLPTYGRAAVQLAERGFVVFVPHNLYRNESRYRPLNRKANTVKATLYSLLVHQHDQILRWLKTLDYVDGDRIGFYGLSFGGETALRVPPVLEGYALSISSGYFNQWARKVAGTDDPYNYVFTDEWEVPVFNAGHTFDHAELAYLMVPRPFMVERGHYDHVADDRWVAHEYARVRRLFALLGLADRTEIAFFQGGHSMRLDAALEFLHEHLEWPTPDEAP